MCGEGLGCLGCLGMVGRFGGGLGMLEDVWLGDVCRSGNCRGSSHWDLDGKISTLYFKEEESSAKVPR